MGSVRDRLELVQSNGIKVVRIDWLGWESPIRYLKKDT